MPLPGPYEHQTQRRSKSAAPLHGCDKPKTGRNKVRPQRAGDPTTFPDGPWRWLAKDGGAAQQRRRGSRGHIPGTASQGHQTHRQQAPPTSKLRRRQIGSESPPPAAPLPMWQRQRRSSATHNGRPAALRPPRTTLPAPRGRLGTPFAPWPSPQEIRSLVGHSSGPPVPRLSRGEDRTEADAPRWAPDFPPTPRVSSHGATP